MLDLVMQRERNTVAALKILMRLLRNQPVAPESIGTDGLASYGAALEQLHLRHLNNRRTMRQMRTRAARDWQTATVAA